MRSLRFGWMWAAAAWVALTVLLRIARGEVVVLSSHAAPVVRLVALALVFLAGCAEKLRPGPPQDQPAEPGGDLSQGTAPAGGQDGGAAAAKPGPAAPAPAEAVPPAEQGGDLSQGTAPAGGQDGGAAAAKPGPAAPAPAEAVPPVAQVFPPELTEEGVAAMYGWIEPRGVWRRMAAAQASGSAQALLDRMPLDGERRARAERLVAAFEAMLARQKKGEAETAATLDGLLQVAEAAPLYDAWLAGFVWLQARSLRPAPVSLFARIERHLRVTHALVLAQRSTGPVEFSAWRSKAGPPPGWRGEARVPAGLAKAARKLFDAGVDAGAWETGAVLPLTVAQGSVVMVRRGAGATVGAGAGLRLRRLDVVRAPAAATLRHATLGALVLPAGAEVTAWNAGEFLGPEARTWVRARVEAALTGDAAALAELEATLPATHAAIREAVRARPDAPGAAALRTLLTAFDE